MGRRKGTEKTGGRVAGTPNKVTGTVKEWIAGLIDKNRAQVEKDLKMLEPKERLQVLEKLMQYVVPKQATVATKIDFNSLTEAQLDEIINRLTEGVKDENTD